MEININGFIVTDAIWFNGNPLTSLGIIMGTTEDGRKEAYIGNARKHSEKEDTEHIAKNGSYLPPMAVAKIMKHLEPTEREYLINEVMALKKEESIAFFSELYAKYHKEHPKPIGLGFNYWLKEVLSSLYDCILSYREKKDNDS